MTTAPSATAAPARRDAIFADLVAATLDAEIVAAFSSTPVDLDACERVIDSMRHRHGMNYVATRSRVESLVPGVDYEGIAYDIDTRGELAE